MEKKYSLRYVLSLMLAASALTCLLVTAVFLRSLNKNNSNTPNVREFATLLQMIKDLYIGEYDEDDISADAMRAAVWSLGDDWSYYLSPEEYAFFMDSSNNRFAGIGVGVSTDEETGGIYVDYVYENSPAEVAGILKDDIIIAVDGEDVTGMTVDEMRTVLSRSIGEKAELTILRPDESIVTLTVEYDYVYINPVSFVMLDDGIGYISITNFDYGAAESFIAAIDELIADEARAFIFDVRYNGGGRVVEMTEMLDYVLPEGEIFISVDRAGTESVTLSGPEMIDFPCVVLVDANSYSAAEYFAATLREYEYATIVGEQTTGKSRMQTTYTMPGGGALHISTDQYVTKNRVKLHDVGGLTPDYEIALTDEEYSLFLSRKLEKDEDPQLLKAISLLG